MKGYVPPPRMSLSNEPLPITRNITITEGISVKDLAEKLGIRAKDLIARLLARGVFATINQTLDAELASEMARIFGADTDVITFEEQAAKDTDAGRRHGEEGRRRGASRVRRWSPSWATSITARPACSTPSARPALPKAKPAASRSTSAPTRSRSPIRIRRPSAARSCSSIRRVTKRSPACVRADAKVTDIVVLVVAADDGVMPQTLEAIDHAHAANVPIIVAVNKIDKPDAMPDRVKKQLADRGLMPEDWGGNTVFVDVSAKKKTNLNLLMEMICLVADLQDLKATPDRPATGVVLEAKLDRGRGPVATVLVQNGTLRDRRQLRRRQRLRQGPRHVRRSRQPRCEAAPPSTPVEILGLEGLPQAGDQFVAVADRDKARGISEYREAEGARSAAGQEFARLAGRTGGADQDRRARRNCPSS